jgi:hypothetical protein
VQLLVALLREHPDEEFDEALTARGELLPNAGAPLLFFNLPTDELVSVARSRERVGRRTAHAAVSTATLVDVDALSLDEYQYAYVAARAKPAVVVY